MNDPLIVPIQIYILKNDVELLLPWKLKGKTLEVFLSETSVSELRYLVY